LTDVRFWGIAFLLLLTYMPFNRFAVVLFTILFLTLLYITPQQSFITVFIGTTGVGGVGGVIFG
jgi:hypothetical protein